MLCLPMYINMSHTLCTHVWMGALFLQDEGMDNVTANFVHELFGDARASVAYMGWQCDSIGGVNANALQGAGWGLDFV